MELAVEAVRPRLTVVLLVTNQSIFPIRIEDEFEGHFTYGGRPLRIGLSLSVQPARRLLKGETAKLIVEQWLTREEAEALDTMFHHNHPVELVLRSEALTIRYTVEDPAGDHSERLPLMDFTWIVHDPDHPEGTVGKAVPSTLP